MKTAGNVILQFEPLNTYYSKLSCKMSYTPSFDSVLLLFLPFCILFLSFLFIVNRRLIHVYDYHISLMIEYVMFSL